MRTSLSLFACVVVLAVGCGDDGPPMTGDTPEILSIEAADPTLPGGEIRVTGVHFDRLGLSPTLLVSGESLPLAMEGDTGELFFSATEALVDTLGPGRHTVDAVVSGNVSSPPFPFELSLETELPLSLTSVPRGDVHRNELVVIDGGGFLADGEGIDEARFVGTFTADAGGSGPVDATIPLTLAERFARDRAIVRLTTAIGGVQPGTFDGTMQILSETLSGARSQSEEITVSLRFLPPELITLTPNPASLEQIVTVQGAGFLGGPDEADEFTVIRLEGMFEPAGDPARAFGPEELVLEWISGTEMRTVIESVERRDELQSVLFGAARGTFMGTATLIVQKGAEAVEAPPLPFAFTLGPVTQVAWVRFLPGFYDSLGRFGLAAAANEIEPLVEARIEGIYDRWNVDVRLEQPEDFSPNGYATIEIGGPDPNGIGLFGYDNTPGKDLNNVRLFDKIGGANAETQEDGFPGFGGVFVESFLYWSSHPELPGSRPPGAPDADPLFDEIFDPVRADPASLAEIRGEGGRIEVVQRALHALASLVGETTAHELGHSLGLAEPYGGSMVFHNPVPADGCLMDSGGSRPIGERTQQPGFAETVLCYDGPDYMDDILGD